MILHPFQDDIISDCQLKKSGGLSIPMGSGKTIISLNIALKNKKENKPILIIASKTLVSSWEQEIKKWYPDTSYNTLNLNDNILLSDIFIITTPTTLVKYYKQYNVQSKLIYKQRDNPFGPEISYYHDVNKPLCSLEYPTFYAVNFSTLIVDEAHNYMNIETLTCRAISSICSDYKWLLSGTLFSEPKPSNILGFLRMCNAYMPNYPDNLPLLKRLIQIGKFRGIGNTIVSRNDNEMFINRPKITKTIVKYEMNEFEKKVYQVYKMFISQISRKLSVYKMAKNKEQVKHLNATLLGMITKLRLCMISPILPLSRLYIQNIDNGNADDIYKVVQETLETNGISKYLELEESLESTRIKKIIESINNHKDERILVFSSFRMTLDYLHMIIKKNKINRMVFTIDANMSVSKREKVIEEYSQSNAGILLMTYTIGCEGLNLQSASVAIIMDVWWNEAKSRQAIARVYRYGQKQNISVYIFISNTYIEHCMFDKHNSKANIANEILTGEITTKVKSISLQKIVDILLQGDFDDNIIMRSIN
jgi:SNF2 family DNA or RNA helicase